MHPSYATVAARAHHRCEYCHAPEIISNMAFEVDHTTPLARGGSDDLENLALACRICNLRKSDHIQAIDPTSQIVVPLFNPRHHHWSEHFETTSQSPYTIQGITPIGRATVTRLEFNSPLQLRARDLWVTLGIFNS